MGLDAIRGAQAGGVRRPPSPPSGRSGELVPGGSPGARPYAVVRCTRRGGGAGRVGPPATRRRLRLLRQIDDELVASVEQYLRVSSRS